MLVKQANEDLLDVTPTCIITGNLIRTYFGVDNLYEVHTSLNDTNKLRYCVNKIQKEKHPFGQDLLGVVYNFSRNIDNFQDYVQRLTTSIAYQCMFNALFDLVKQFNNDSAKFNHIHEKGWTCIIGDLNIAQLTGLGEALALIDNSYTWEKHLIYIFKSCQAEEVELIFDELLTLDSNLIDWVRYYKQPYIIASLNPNISKISYDSWHIAPNNMNCAEAAHAISNREGKQLKGQRIDMHNFKRVDIKAHYNVNLSGQDKSNIARKKLAIKRSIIDLTDESQNSNEPKESSMTMMEELEYEERMLMIAERKKKLRELRISNAIKEHEY
ncbi:21478_t:CDS:2, partial [Cetraspora pellucida]